MSDHRLYSFGNLPREDVSLDSKVDLSEFPLSKYANSNDDVRNDQTKGQDNYQHSGLISRVIRFGRDILDVYRFRSYFRF